MRPFFRNIMIFFLPPLIYFIVMGLHNFSIYKQGSERIKPSSVLLIGDSHTEYALNPDYFNNAINISKIAEPYLVTYWKIRKHIDEIQPDTILLGFAPHNLTEFFDHKLTSREQAAALYDRCYYLVDPVELHNLKIDARLTDFLRVFWKRNCIYPIENHHAYINNFARYDKSNLTNLKNRLKAHYRPEGSPVKISDFQLAYLDTILDFNDKKGIVTVLVCPPVHKSYYDSIPILDIYNEQVSQLEDRGYLVIDSLNQFYPDTLYKDVDHLNIKGANRFTKGIAKLLNEQRRKGKSS